MEDQYAITLFDRVIDLTRRGNPEKTIEFVKNNGRRIAFEMVDSRNTKDLTDTEKKMLLGRAIELLIALADFSKYLLERENARRERLSAVDREIQDMARLRWGWVHDNEFAQLPLSNMATGLAYLVARLMKEVGGDTNIVRAAKTIEKLRDAPLIHHTYGVSAIEEAITHRLGELNKMREIRSRAENRAIEVKKLPR